MQVRSYTVADRDAVVQLHQELQAYERAFRPSRAEGRTVSEWQVGQYEAMLTDDEDARLLVADRDGAVVGFVFFLAERERLEEEEGQLYVQDITVASNCRRSGIGSALMDEVRKFARQRGLSRIDLQVLVGNDQAEAFYRSQGFQTAYLGMKGGT